MHTRNVMEVFLLEMTDRNGQKLSYQEDAYGDHVCLSSGEAKILFCFENERRMRIKGENCNLRLTMENQGYDSAIKMNEDTWQVNSATHMTNFMLRPFQGKLQMDAPWNSEGCERIIAEFQQDENGEWEGVIEEAVINPQIPLPTEKTFEECRQDAERALENWTEKLPAVPPRFEEGRKLAGYVMWSAYLYPVGHYKREAMVMSKNWMNCVWSWDHCFNAMALAAGNRDEALDQFLVMFDHQHESGALPDCINDAEVLWNFLKTPIHGWAFCRMAEKMEFAEEELEEIYRYLTKWTDWWFAYRDYDHDGMPQCNHGNDSVSDNCTTFDKGCPLETPVLSAFLILQMDALSEIAQKLDKQAEADKWTERSREHLDNFMRHFWTEDGIVARLSGSHEPVTADSNYMYIPIVLGKRLPEEVQKWLIDGLKRENYLRTPYGFASESPSSPFYESDSYCRGPVWAPTTMIILDGLRQLGENELAAKVAEGFCSAVQEGHISECFDAVTGKPLRDPAYTWTASVFLILASEYLEK